ncbi:opioid growth factor receptor-related protein [Allocoleopsis sp.]|uniref:opioid growth factor receptor-related protein n=1 Tax=Allocoleopsis sp. TaxID=3088169 RepID=UPI002FCF7DAD
MYCQSGLQLSKPGNGQIAVTQSDEYRERISVWLNRFNHNYLRITRILTSLSLLGLEDDAKAFFNGLDQIYLEEGDPIGSEPYLFWKKAVIF